MVQNRQVTLLGDSILKGIQVDLGDRRYRTHNEINVEACQTAEAGRDGQHRELRSGERTGGCFTLCEGDEAEAVCACCPLHSLRKVWAFSHKKSDAFQRRIFAAIGQ